MYAIFKSGGKQYKVVTDAVVKLEKLSAIEGEVIQLGNVLALGDENGVKIGTPFIDSATVSAQVIKQGKDEKVLIFKKKRRQNYRRKKGLRQHITVVRILDVSGKGDVTLKVKALKEASVPAIAEEQAVAVVEKKVKAKAKAKAEPKAETSAKKEKAVDAPKKKASAAPKAKKTKE